MVGSMSLGAAWGSAYTPQSQVSTLAAITAILVPAATPAPRHGAESVAEAFGRTEGALHTETDIWEQPDEWLDGQSTVRLADRDLLAVPTPGHTQGHMVFADVDRALLFAGDHVLPRITPSVGFEAAFAEQPLGDYLRSLRR